jgi:MoaA/NifB/PqqE/SkfB family radical SAM enzyme
MSSDVLRRICQTITELLLFDDVEPVDLNGHGETTILRGWTEVVLRLAEQGVRVRLTSNFAKDFGDDELYALSLMSDIAISIDSSDRQFLRTIRRRVDLRQIITNMIMIRTTALKYHRKPPRFSFLCGLYDRNTLDWDQFARFAVSCRVQHVGLWNLTIHPDIAIGANEKVLALDDLSDAELVPRLRCIRQGLAILERHRITYDVQGDFISALMKRVKLDEQRTT